MVQTIAFQVKLLSQCVFQSYTVGTVIIWIYHHKVVIPAFLHFSVRFMCNDYMYNDSETWHILKSSCVERTPIYFFEIANQFVQCHQNLRMLRKCPRFPYSRVFFNYNAVNDNKTTNNYLRLSDF